MEQTEQLLYKPPVLDIGGVDCQMKRLNIFEILELGTIVSKCANVFTPEQWVEMGEEIKTEGGSVNVEAALKLVVQLLPVVGQELIVFLGNLVGLNEEEVHDGDKFPLGSELKIANALLECPDVVSFFTEGKVFVKNLSAKNILGSGSSQSKSIRSKAKQGGHTNKL